MRKQIPVLLSILFLSSLAMGEKAYRPDKDGYLRDWLVAGPFPSEPGEIQPEGFDRDFLTAIGGEDGARPFAGLKISNVVFPADKGKLVARVGATNAWGYNQDKAIDVEWKELHWKDDSPIIKLDDVSKDFADHIVIYLCAYVYCPDDRKAQVRLGSDDDYKLWVNGKFVGQKAINRGPKIDDEILPVELCKGLNTVLMKVCERAAGTAAVLRFTDEKGNPMTDLKIEQELPEHRYKAACKNIQRVDAVDDGLFAQLDMQDPPFFTGETKLEVRLGCEKSVSADVTIQFGPKDGPAVWTETKTVPLELTNAWEFEKGFSIDNPGPYVLSIEAKGIGTIERPFDVFGSERLREEKRKLTKRVENLKEQLEKQSARLKQLQTKLAAQKRAVAEQYKKMASLYTAHRNRKIEEFGPAARSIDKPFTPIPNLRAKLCMNGDFWEIVPAKNTDQSTFDENTIPTEGWESITVPTFGIERYFRYRWWPVKTGTEFRYAPGDKALDKDAACGFAINPGRENGAMFLRTHLNLPKDWTSRRVLFSAGLAEDKIKIWANGKLLHEGMYDWMMPLETDITAGMQPGENSLVVYTGRARRVSEETWGLQDDVYLKSVPNVYVEDCWVIPHWRQATIETRTRITNTTDQPQKLILNQQAVLKGRVRRDFGDATVDIPANSAIEIKQDKPWSDPELWDVGSPVLYQLVSTLRRDGKPVDQHFQRFGYREFWKSKFDYWLNGRRFFIQGEVCSSLPSATRQYYTLFFTLLRDLCNINTIRAHVDYPQNLYADVCDELGMLFIPNMYPSLGGMPKEIGPDDIADFQKSKVHEENLQHYTAWVRWLRNHPSVVIYATDNEVFTQAWPKPWDDDIRSDRAAALYEPFVLSLDPTRLVTRDGDQGTWGKLGAWQQDPPAQIANYHYPEFENLTYVHNWQSAFEKPVLYGETLYCSYGAWDNWIGAIPSQVAKKANRVRQFIGLYRELEVSGWVGMGPGHDGFIELKSGGTPFDAMPEPKTPEERMEWYRQGKVWLGARLRWPAQSGPGFKQEFGTGPNRVYGQTAINWYVPEYPVCVPNAVNRAYKETARPVPEAPKTRAPEVIFRITKGGAPMPGAMVFLKPLVGQGTESIGVRADTAGKAWFVLQEPGTYELSVDGTDFKKTVEIRELPNDIKAGLDYMPHVDIEINLRKS